MISTVSLARLPRADGYGAADPYRGFEDAGEELPLEARDARCFRLPMPAEPYSFRGKLVRLDWELIVDFPLVEVVVALVLSPSRATIVLYPEESGGTRDT